MESADLTEKPMTPEQARQVLEAEQSTRLQQCQAEVQPLLEQIAAITQKYKCHYGPQVRITPDGRIVAEMVIGVNAA